MIIHLYCILPWIFCNCFYKYNFLINHWCPCLFCIHSHRTGTTQWTDPRLSKKKDKEDQFSDDGMCVKLNVKVFPWYQLCLYYIVIILSHRVFTLTAILRCCFGMVKLMLHFERQHKNRDRPEYTHVISRSKYCPEN